MKNKYTKLVLLFSALLLVLGNVNAQSGGLSLRLISYTIDSSGCTRDSGDTHGGGGNGGGGMNGGGELRGSLKLTISASLTNTDTVTYNGPVSLAISNGTSNLTNTPGVFIQPQELQGPITLPAGATLSLGNVVVNVSAPAFAPGPDVVVVWPVSLAVATDSISIAVVVPSAPVKEDPQNITTGITETTSETFSYIVGQTQLQLVNLSAGLSFKQVRIFDIMGQQVAAATGEAITTVTLPNTIYGAYTAELITGTGNRKIIRFIH